jgi:sugar lactone lactonase YvrE
MIGGLALNEDGALLCSGTGGIVWLQPATGAGGTLVDTIHGALISGVNDMTPDGRGGLIFGTVDHERMFRGERYFGGSAIYRLSADRQLTLLCADIGFANGLGLSPDSRTLYINNSGVGTFAHEQRADGSLGPARQLSARADCDGLAVDEAGGIWIACIASGKLVRLTPDGATDREIIVEGDPVTSLCFGGLDRRDLYVTTAAPGAGAAVMKRVVPESLSASLLSGRADEAGVPLQHTRFELS